METENISNGERKVAFFDIDGTVFRSSLIIELVEKLISEGIFYRNVREMYEAEYEAWLNREGDYEAYVDAVVRAFMTNIKGIFYGDLADVGRLVVAEQSKRVYRYTRDLIQKLKADDYYIVAISQSPKTILHEFCSSHGFDKVYGRIYEIGPQDLFTGEMIDVHLIQNKASIIRRVADQDGVTLVGSIGVGDTEGDIALLESVEKPICFNPNKKLYTYARQMKWKVVVERKDVIYELDV